MSTLLHLQGIIVFPRSSRPHRPWQAGLKRKYVTSNSCAHDRDCIEIAQYVLCSNTYVHRLTLVLDVEANVNLP